MEMISTLCVGLRYICNNEGLYRPWPVINFWEFLGHVAATNSLLVVVNHRFFCTLWKSFFKRLFVYRILNFKYSQICSIPIFGAFEYQWFWVHIFFFPSLKQHLKSVFSKPSNARLMLEIMGPLSVGPDSQGVTALSWRLWDYFSICETIIKKFIINRILLQYSWNTSSLYYCLHSYFGAHALQILETQLQWQFFIIRTTRK